MGGPSQQQQDIAAQQQQFMGTMQKDYGQMFAGQTSILSSLQSAWNPVLQAGISQYGFSPAEDAALRSQATDTTALQYRNAAQAVNGQLAARSGDSVLPSGTDAQIKAQVAEQAAAQQSSEQLGITQAGYDQGRQNFSLAANALGGVAQTMNPTGYAGQATGAGSAAYSSAYQNQQMQNQKWSQLGSILGGVAQAGLGFATGGASMLADAGLNVLQPSYMPGGGPPTSAPSFMNMPSGSFGTPPTF